MLPRMFKRQRTGSVVCASCGSLVGVNDEKCYTCGRRNPGLWGFGPLLRRLGSDWFVNVILYGCSALYVLGLVLTVASGGNIMGGGANPLGMLAPANPINLMLGASGQVPVYGYGFWWSVLSAGWLHGSALHILFNMMWVRDLGPVTADSYGPSRMVIIYTIASVCGFLLSSTLGLFSLPFFGAPFTVGASAPIFGLLGALVRYGQRGGSSMLHAQAKNYAIILFVFGFIMPGIDNAAHAGGFIGGYLAGMLFDPLKRENLNHMVWALGCIVLTALAVLASVIKVGPVLFG
jgi:rhomboid protease GluP